MRLIPENGNLRAPMGSEPQQLVAKGFHMKYILSVTFFLFTTNAFASELEVFDDWLGQYHADCKTVDQWNRVTAEFTSDLDIARKNPWRLGWTVTENEQQHSYEIIPTGSEYSWMMAKDGPSMIVSSLFNNVLTQNFKTIENETATVSYSYKDGKIDFRVTVFQWPKSPSLKSGVLKSLTTCTYQPIGVIDG